MAPANPDLILERELLVAGASIVIGCDEVGRGAIAGPVAVGVCVINSDVGPIPVGLRDSKLLSEKRREELAPLAIGWAVASAVGYASAGEVDALGITVCLGLAGRRALLELHGRGVDVRASIILLDGNHDWLNPVLTSKLRVHTHIKADRDCASVAAASVIAKVHRDRFMIDADAREPGYEWSGNKGYGSAGHFAAIERLGVSSIHRLSWLKPAELHGQTAPLGESA